MEILKNFFIGFLILPATLFAIGAIGLVGLFPLLVCQLHHPPITTNATLWWEFLWLMILSGVVVVYFNKTVS